MRTALRLLFLLLSTIDSSNAQTPTGEGVRHFIFFSEAREGIHDSAFYCNKGIAGAQITYPWRQLEPRKDHYDFLSIRKDLSFLSSKGKRLFIQIQDVTFDSALYAVPDYLIGDPAYHGGQARQCEERDGSVHCEGWMARRWDTAVTHRYQKLLRKLAAAFDGKIEGINLPETAIGVDGTPLPEGYTEEGYLAALEETMRALRRCFKTSVPILYANFMPGGPDHLKTVYAYAKEIRLGVGGPDILVNKPFQMINSYPLIREISSFVLTGMAVQEGDYDIIDKNTGKKVTVPGILDFAEHYLRLHYIFWCTEEPFYRREVLPMLSRERARQ